jgi:thiol-disulfide isomerase/thioredoxin
MKILVFSLFIVSLFSFSNPKSLLNSKMPEIKGETLNGVKINADYFKNKVTLINFMSIGCPPCMKEINVLNEINCEFKSDSFQVLCISPTRKNLLLPFISENPTPDQKKWRKLLAVERINYEVLPECFQPPKGNDPNVYNPPICNNASKLFKVAAYPKTYLIDRKGIIRKIYEGFAVDEPFINKFKEEYIKDIKAQLAER